MRILRRVRKLAALRGISEFDLVNHHSISIKRLSEPDVATLQKLKKILKVPYQMLIDGTIDDVSFDDYIISFEDDVARIQLELENLRKTG